MSAFETALDRLLGNEGGYVWDPLDPGGETNWGISKRSYPGVDIKGLTRDQAAQIYKRDFWDRIRSDEMHQGLAFQMLDFAVNSGIETAVRKLQQVIGVADDGHWGPISAQSLALEPPSKLMFKLLAARLDYMRKLSTWPRFGAGWAGRIAQDMRFAAGDC